MCRAAKAQEKGRRRDGSEQELHRLSQCLGDSVSLRSLLAQCSFWSWEHKHPSHFYLFLCGEKGREGKRLQALCIFR